VESVGKALFKKFTGGAKDCNPWKVKVRSWLCTKKALPPVRGPVPTELLGGEGAAGWSCCAQGGVA
jgi:hypothetical protein